MDFDLTVFTVRKARRACLHFCYATCQNACAKEVPSLKLAEKY